MKNLSPTWAHVIVGLAIIAATCVMACLHVLSGTEASTVIVGIGGVLLGTSSVSMGAANATTAAETLTSTPSQPVTKPPVQVATPVQ